MKRILIVAAVFFIAGVVIAWRNETFKSMGFENAENAATLLVYRMWQSIPILLVGALIHASRRTPRLLWLSGIVVILQVVASLLLLKNEGWGDYYWLAHTTLLIISLVTAPFIMIPTMILLIYRFQGKWDRIRLLTLAALAIEIVAGSIGLVMQEAWLTVLVGLLLLSSLVLLLISAWCIAFRNAIGNEQRVETAIASPSEPHS